MDFPALTAEVIEKHHLTPEQAEYLRWAQDDYEATIDFWYLLGVRGIASEALEAKAPPDEMKKKVAEANSTLSFMFVSDAVEVAEAMVARGAEAKAQ